MNKKAETASRFGASIPKEPLIMEAYIPALSQDSDQEKLEMNTYERMEAAIKVRGIRTEERLKVLRTLQSHGGAAKLIELAEQHEHAIKEAAQKVREAIR